MAVTKKTQNKGEPMSDVVVNRENYHTLEIDRRYMSWHQYRNWMTCAYAEHARQAGLWTPEVPETFLVGQYADILLLEPEREAAWIEQNKGVVCMKKGDLKQAYRDCVQMVARLKREPVAQKMLTGKHQWILTGLIGASYWKIMIDCIIPERKIFWDFKTAKDMGETFYDHKRGTRLIWYDHYGYWGQLAIYREIIKQNYGEDYLPMILGVSKQDPPDICGLSFQDTTRLDEELQKVKNNIQEVLEWKSEKDGSKLQKCGNCPYCRATKTLEIVPAENRGMPQW